MEKQKLVWILGVIVFLVLLAGAVIAGLWVEGRFGGVVLTTLPKSITSKWVKTPLPTVAETKPVTEVVISPQVSISSVSASPTTVIEPTPPSDNTGFILTFSNTRKVTTNDLTSLSPWELKVARNEIYARHGRSFVSHDLSCYFAKQAWYAVDLSYSDAKLSAVESSNAVFILNFEKSIDSPLTNTDSGCK